MLNEKYCPKKCSDIIGQGEAIKKLILCIENNKHVLIHGPVGTGKTSAVCTVANKLNCDIIELNASDFRSKRKINEIVGNSVKQQSLFGKQKLIFIDELEGLSGQKDRGCLTEITKFISESRYPIILVSNKLNRKLSKLKKKCRLIEFVKPDYKLILAFLKEICKRENIIVNESILTNISSSCNGDIRAALNDTNVLYLGDREKKSTIQDSLKLIFKSKSAVSVLDAFNKIDENLDECIMWLDENIPSEYSLQDLQKAYYYLSKADIFRKRIFRHQYYRFLNYVNILLTAGISVSKEKINIKSNTYKQSSRILKMWIAKQRHMKKNVLAKELAVRCHCSTKKMIREMPYLNIIQ